MALPSADNPATIWNQNAALADADMLVEEKIIAQADEQPNAFDIRLRHEIDSMRENS